MTTTFELHAQSRTDRGRAAARRMRRLEDRVPAVVYGAHKEPESISLAHKEVIQALSHEAVFSSILTLQVDGKPEKVVLKKILRHSHKPKVLHIDFQRVKAKEKITMVVPIHLMGEDAAPGIKNEGGVLTKNMTEVEVRCLPGDLPEFLELDMSTMALDDTLHLSDLKLPKGVELTVVELDEEHNVPIVSVHIPKVAKEDIEAEQHEAELAEEAHKEAEAEAADTAPEEAAAGSETDEASADAEKAEDATESPKEKKE